MNEIEKKCKFYRISKSEYEKICEVLARPPKGVEWALFSALWNEHCSYKSSKFHLRKFSYKNSKVLQSEGENAGIVDLGQGEKVAFKMESHNHPSFIEPYQGAATGVGGILRDIFTMGARPIALADYLCFGEKSDEKRVPLAKGVVSGISGYGNCVGVPTVTGQTEYHSAYNKNILVNAMAVGLLREGDPIALSKANGPGNYVVYVGAKTGKDGVHGASMASESFDNNSESKKPNVQIGDPFYEKLLIESCLEVLKENLVVAMQDMGAAGLTSSSFEMASKGGVGLEMDLDKVPLRDMSMSPEEILLSESQERMLLVCLPEKFKRLQELFHRWGLEASVVGKVTKGPNVVLRWKGETLTDIDPNLLVENAPVYQRPYFPWQPKNSVTGVRRESFDLYAFLKSGPLHSKEWIYQQYDQRVGAKTAMDSSNSVAMLRLPDSGRGLAIAVGCRPPVMRMDAQIGAYDSVLYPSLQMAVKGARVQAITDCLNFGNPEKPEIMSEFVASVEAIAEASRLLDAPVVSGNVSFYNETLGQNITSTPATGLVGLRDSIEKIPSDYFEKTGEKVYLLCCPMIQSVFTSINGDQNFKPQFQGRMDLPKFKRFFDFVLGLQKEGVFSSSRAVGRGGVLGTLALMSLKSKSFRAMEETQKWDLSRLSVENFYEIVFSVSPENTSGFEAYLKNHGKDFICENIGETCEANYFFSSNYDINKLKDSYHNNDFVIGEIV